MDSAPRTLDIAVGQRRFTGGRYQRAKQSTLVVADDIGFLPLVLFHSKGDDPKNLRLQHGQIGINVAFVRVMGSAQVSVEFIIRHGHSLSDKISPLKDEDALNWGHSALIVRSEQCRRSVAVFNSGWPSSANIGPRSTPINILPEAVPRRPSLKCPAPPTQAIVMMTDEVQTNASRRVKLDDQARLWRFFYI